MADPIGQGAAQLWEKGRSLGCYLPRGAQAMILRRIPPAILVLLLPVVSPAAAHVYQPPVGEPPRDDRPRPAAKRLADLNAGEPRTVRMIYFLPSDRRYRAEVVRGMKDDIRKAQSFFAEQMQAYGYGNRTFRFETDAQGEPMVHRVDGQYPSSHYVTDGVWQYRHFDELEQVWDFYLNTYVVYTDQDIGWDITGGRTWKESGWVDIRLGADFKTLAHELGHTFGLPHDFRDGAYVMSYRGPSQSADSGNRDRISACAAEFLSVHPYFNSDIPIEGPPAAERLRSQYPDRYVDNDPPRGEDASPPSIELVYPTEFPGDSRSFPIILEVSDADGLHQVLLNSGPSGAIGLRECRTLEGEVRAVVEFEYDGSSMLADPNRAITSLSDSLHPVEVFAVDTDGNLSELKFDLARDRVTDALEGHTGSVNAVAFSPDRTTLASGSSDGTVKLWNLSRRELLATLEGHGYPVRAVAFSRGGTLASASWSDGIKLWDVETRNEAAALEGIAPVAFSPDGTLLASGSENRTIALWDARTLEEIATLEGHSERINTVAFSPDGALFASGSEDQTVRLWDVEKREEVATFGHSGAVWSVAFSPNGALLASLDNQVRRWDVRTRREVKREANLWHSGDVWSVAFLRAASLLATGWGDGSVLLYDSLTLEYMGAFPPLRPRPGGVRSLAISHDETTLAAGRENHTIELRDVSKWKRAFPYGLKTVSGPGPQPQGAAGSALAEPFVVLLLDQQGDPLPGVTVTFVVTAGGGTLSATTATTDADGHASATLTLGPQPGTNTVEATVVGLEPVTFTVVGLAVPRTLSRVPGRGQQGAAGTTLARPFVVLVLDRSGNPLAGATVAFAVTAGGGTLSVTTATTDADGRASTTLTLGPQPGSNTVEATVAGLRPVTFTATAKATPDFDGDGVTDFSDFFLFAEAFGGSDPRFDLDGSGTVDFPDFFLFAESFGQPARAKLVVLARELIGLPDGPQLQQNAPNPFNGGTVISWFQLQTGLARLEVFALTGQRVAVLHQGPAKAGLHRLRWDGRDSEGRALGSGVYLYRLVTGEGVLTRKLSVLR